MSDLISREAVIALINASISDLEYADENIAMQEAIKMLPTIEADARLVRFAEWVADWILRSDFQESAGGFAELACRRLEELGIMRKEGHYWVRNEAEE